MKNHIQTEIREKCSGCGVCAYICPVDAISLCIDDEGYYAPKINVRKCTNCGKCLKYCHLQGTVQQILYPIKEQYAAKLIDEETRMESRSGGVFVALSDEILARGGVVYGAVLNGNTEVVHIRAETKEERNRMCGSKYVQSNISNMFTLLKKDICSGKLVFFSGTPCQIAAIANCFGTKFDNLYFCDFICHGVPSPMVWRDYINWIQRKYCKSITSVDFRDKKAHSWESHVERISMGDQVLYSRRFTNIFYSNNCLRRSCYECPYTTLNRVCDFTIADYWGIDEVDPSFNDSKGVSLVMIRSDKGSKLFDDAKSKMKIIDTLTATPIHYNLKRPTAIPDTRHSFWCDYRKHGFEFVSRKYGRYDILRRIKYKIVDKID